MDYIIKKITAAEKTKSGMKELATEFSGFTPERYNEIINYLVQHYEGPALSKILIVSAINGIKLDSVVLASAFNLTDELIDAYFPYKFQDASAIPPLLAIANNMLMTVPAFVTNPMWIATELALKFNEYKQDILDTLLMLSHLPKLSNNTDIIEELKKFLNAVKYGDPNVKWRIDLNPLQELAEQEVRMIHASAHSRGVQYKLWEFGKLNAASMGERELINKFRDAIDLRLFDKAYEFLFALYRRKKKSNQFFGEAVELCQYGLLSRNLDLVHKVHEMLPENQHSVAEKLIIKIIENPEMMDLLEELCRIALVNLRYLHSVNLLLDFQGYVHLHYPALSILLTRAAFVTFWKDREEIDELLEGFHSNRVRIGLKPDGDPIEQLLSQISEMEQLEVMKPKIANLENKIDDLEKKNSIYKTDIKTKWKEINRLEKEVANLKSKLKGTPDYQSLKKERDDLKQTLEVKKLELKNCKIMINEEKDKNHLSIGNNGINKETQHHEAKEVEHIREIDSIDSTQFLIPEYEKSFVTQLNKIDPMIAKKALKAVHSFAIQEEKILADTIELESLANHYRIKFDENYRLMIQWKPGKSVTILDVIPRQSLETWIKNRKNGR